jgi:sugar lactone lactonase YvrE
MSEAEVVATGFTFPEGPRWRDGQLWFSDVHAAEILRWDSRTGAITLVARVPQRPSGLGFLPDGTLLVASKWDRRVVRVESVDTLITHADLSAIASWHINDLIVDSVGRAYVGNYGDASAPPAPAEPAVVALVQADGTATAATEGLMFPNGMVITKDARTLIVAETRSDPGRLSAFTIDPDTGALSDRRILVTFDDTVFPDGLAIDDEDGVWVASPFSHEVIHVSADGSVDARVQVDNPYAVALGGADGRDLFVCTADTWVPEIAERDRTGAIRRLRVDVPAAVH